MTSPLFTVALPIHNGERHVGTAIESVLSQECTDFEMIVVDDGSTDGTVEIVRHVAEQDDRLRLITRSHASGGPALPRNTVLEHARGTWLALIDHDDVWAADRLASQVRLTRGPADLIYGRAWQEQSDPSGSEIVDYHQRWDLLDGDQLPRGNVINQLARGNFVPVSTVSIRVELCRDLGGFSTRHPGADELLLWLRAAAAGAHFEAVDHHVATYRWHDGNFSRSRPAERARSVLGAYTDLVSEHPEYRELFRPAIDSARGHLVDGLLREVRNGRLPATKRLSMAGEAIRLRPTGQQLRDFSGLVLTSQIRKARRAGRTVRHRIRRP